MGIHTFAVCSDGTLIDSPRALERSLRKLRRRARAVSRKQCGSRNRVKATLAVARCHRRIRNQRADALHKATTALAKAKSVIVVEDLHVAGLLRNGGSRGRSPTRGGQSSTASSPTNASGTGPGCWSRRAGFRRASCARTVGWSRPPCPLTCGCSAARGAGWSSTGTSTRLGTWPGSPMGMPGPSPPVRRRHETPVERVALARPATAWCNCPQRSRNGPASRHSKMHRLR